MTNSFTKAWGIDMFFGRSKLFMNSMKLSFIFMGRSSIIVSRSIIIWGCKLILISSFFHGSLVFNWLSLMLCARLNKRILIFFLFCRITKFTRQLSRTVNVLSFLLFSFVHISGYLVKKVDITVNCIF